MPRRAFFHLPTPRNCILALLLPTLATTSLRAAERIEGIDVPNVRVVAATGVNNDGQYVDTDIALTSNSVVETELEIANFAYNSSIFTSGDSSSASDYRLYYDVGTGFRFKYNKTTTAASDNAKVELNSHHVVKTSPHGLYLDGELVATQTPANFAPTADLKLFSTQWTSWSRANIRFYRMKIYEPDDNGDLVLEHDLKACGIVGSVLGIYDDITGTVYPCGRNQYYPLGGPIVVRAENGIGNTVALTNALALAARLTSKAYGSRVLLEPGTYNLAGITNGNNHLVFAGKSADTPAGLYLAGMGDSPADTILLGGGQADGRRVISISSLTISNLTVTGGYLAAASYGGGIITTAAGYGTVVDCIVSNNYAAGAAGNGGGGIWGAKLVRNCLIAGNKSNYGGGLRSCSVMEDCIITNNFATTYGGGVSAGKTIRCLIADNRVQYSGGGQTEGMSIDSVFRGNVAGTLKNYGFGGGLHSATATNCVFIGNGDSNCVGIYGSAASSCVLVECTISNSVARRFIFNQCRLRNCHVSNVEATVNSDIQNFRVFGRYEGSVIYTNVNCIVENVTLSNAADRVAVASAFVNCTIRNTNGKKYGPLNSDCTAVNTIVVDCAPYDVTASTAPVMKNCLYQTASGEFAEGRLVDCIQANPRFETDDDLPYLTIRRSSPAYNAGFEDDWLLNLVGDTDFAGNPRRLFGRIDIGALERQSDKLPGLRLSVQ